MPRKRSKRYVEAQQKVEFRKLYSLDEALKILPTLGTAKFDETVDVAFRLGVDPRHAEQMIRGAVALPAGTGKSLKVVVITSGEKVALAEGAGADFVGGDELITKIAGGWLEFDRVIASPEMMGKIGKIGRVLGPRGLMPNPKLGTVTMDVAKAVKEQKAGKVEYKTNKNGIVHVPVGKKSFSMDDLLSNLKVVISAIVKAKPSSAKGIYLKSVTLSTSMGPGIRLETNSLAVLANE